MTLGGRLVALFPLLQFSLSGLSLYRILESPSISRVAVFLFVIYLFPLICLRIHNFLFPLQEGKVDISLPKYIPWWGTHQLQVFYIAIPWIEAPLHFVPGLYSAWLRAWGSKIGTGIYWTPRVEIVDRGLLEIGDGVVVGHLCAFCSHAITPVDGRPLLLVQKIKIGARSLLGGEAGFGPGADVAPGTLVKPQSRIYWKGEYKRS